MYFLTDEGDVVEGVPLTEEEVTIAGEIKDILQYDISEYVSERSRAKCVRVLLEKFSFSLRRTQTTAAQAPQDALTQAAQPVVENLANMPEESI